MRVSNYLSGSKELVFTIRGGDNYDICAYIDASHAVTDNYRSQTGVATVIGGKTMIHWKTNTQKLNTKASTESELVATSDGMPQSIFIKEFVEEILNMPVNLTLMQDNTSTISLIKAGRALSESTRHINIRFFYVHDYVNKGIIKLEYCPTEIMMADGFTKPLQGAKFIEFRNFVLGIV